MANQEHLDILAKGVEAWNGWRRKNRTVIPDLSHTDLHHADLRIADLSGVDMYNACVEGANIRGANLRGAALQGSNFQAANLVGADLRAAYLQNARLRGADVSGARFGNAILTGTDFRGAIFNGTDMRRSELANANFEGAVFGATTLSDVDLSSALNLNEIRHDGPSTLGIDTIYRSQGQIPESFLRGCGVPENFIMYMRSLTGTAFDFYSCFISYSTKDQPFADRLYADLQAAGVRCWFAPHDIHGGRKLHEQIDEAIRVYDKVLLVLSEASMTSEWVSTEISKARKRERQEKRRMLFPISIVAYDAVRDWECFDADVGKDSAREVREYYVPDFSNWKDHDSYSRAFERLVRDLKAGPIDKACGPHAK